MMISPEKVHFLLCDSELNLVHVKENCYLLAADRPFFPLFFNKLGAETGVEIGVQTGDYSVELVKALKGPIYLIDPWKEWPKVIYDDIANVNQAEQDKRYEAVCNLFQHNNVKVIRKTSIEALDDFEDGSLDFAFLDGNHAYDFIKADLNGWWKKLKQYGVMSGHDYSDERGVVRAVPEFTSSKNLKYWYIAGSSYFFVKPDN